MPLFCYVGHDGPAGLEKRPEARPKHLAHAEKLAARFVGPLLDDTGAPCGSLFVFEADDFETARRIANADPYVELGVFERVEVFETKQVLPAAPSASEG
ncbi:MAG: YciI family protein [Myxococcota bacterium]|nr:YciI family protein [Myxococcota bacterium]